MKRVVVIARLLIVGILSYMLWSMEAHASNFKASVEASIKIVDTERNSSWCVLKLPLLACRAYIKIDICCCESDILIKADDNCRNKESCISLAYEEINKVPLNIRKRFIDDGWKIELTSHDINGDKRIAGYTDSSINSIQIYADEKAVYRAVLHEVGHYLDFRDRENGLLSETDEFKEIYVLESGFLYGIDDVGDGHTTSDEREYFAEVFRMVILEPEKCIKNAPKSFSYVVKTIKECR